jgi:hypothetical protein
MRASAPPSQARPKRNELIRQLNASTYDFDLSNDSADVLYTTFRFGPRKELVFKISPSTLMRNAIILCLDAWRRPDGDIYSPEELFFYMPCNNKIDYYKPKTALEVSSFY